MSKTAVLAYSRRARHELRDRVAEGGLRLRRRDRGARRRRPADRLRAGLRARVRGRRERGDADRQARRLRGRAGGEGDPDERALRGEVPADLRALAAGDRGRRRGRRARRRRGGDRARLHRQGQRPAALRARVQGALPRRARDRAAARPDLVARRGDRLRRGARHPGRGEAGVAVLDRRQPLRPRDRGGHARGPVGRAAGGRVRAHVVSVERAGAGRGRDRIRGGRAGVARRRGAVARGAGRRAQRAGRRVRDRPHRHGREPRGRDQEPRAVRGSGGDDAHPRAPGARGSRPDEGGGDREARDRGDLGEDGVRRPVVLAGARGARRVRGEDAGARLRRGARPPAARCSRGRRQALGARALRRTRSRRTASRMHSLTTRRRASSSSPRWRSSSRLHASGRPRSRDALGRPRRRRARCRGVGVPARRRRRAAPVRLRGDARARAEAARGGDPRRRRACARSRRSCRRSRPSRPEDEDVHSAIERQLGEVGRKIHAGRSRNDQVAAAMRLYVRDACREADEAIRGFCSVVLDRADAEAETPMPGYTHLQRAIARDGRPSPARVGRDARARPRAVRSRPTRRRRRRPSAPVRSPAPRFRCRRRRASRFATRSTRLPTATSRSTTCTRARFCSRICRGSARSSSSGRRASSASCGCRSRPRRARR